MPTAAVDERAQAHSFSIFQPPPNEASLPFARTRSRAYSSKRASLSLKLPADAVAALNGLAAPRAAALAAAVACVLYHYSNEQRLCVGTAPPAGSPPNALPLLLLVDPHMPLAALLDAATTALTAAGHHADITFDELLDLLGLADITHRNPLFSVAVRDAHEQAPLSESRCDVVLTCTGSDDCVLEADYSSRLISPDTVERFCNHVARVLAAFDTPSLTIKSVDYLQREERATLLTLGQGELQAWPSSLTVLDLFARQVAANADMPALYLCDSDERWWTYRDLDQISDRYAHALQARGARRGDRIGLCLQIGPEQLMWLLAILKCGSVVVPIDVTFPRYRIENIVLNSELADVIAENSLVELLPEGTRTFMTDGFRPDSETNRFQSPELSGEDPVYLLYTSGSTGRPKGVLMPHRSLANLVSWQNTQTAAAGKRTFHRTSLTFDVSFQEIFATLCFGGALVIADEAERGNISEWPEIFQRQRISRVFLPVIALHQFAEFSGAPLPDLEDLIVAGEALRITPSVMRLFRVLDARLINQYGPTESHVVTSHIMEGSSAGWPMLPPIGRPILNAHILVLTASGQPAPIGVLGEIYIAGPQLALGYFGQETLTSERFCELELAGLHSGQQPRTRAYRTGDYGRFTADGTIEFAGRRDEQVKLRGYRIELGELENMLASIPGVKHAAATLWTDDRGESLLAAYVVCERDDAPADTHIRQILKEKLPDYMVPSVSNLIRIDAIPLTATGKVDRRSLPRPASLDDALGNIPALTRADSVAETIKTIWARRLRVSYIDPQLGFLDLGGHSLLAIQIISEINERLGTAVPLPELLRGPNLTRFTAVVERFAGEHGDSADSAANGTEADATSGVRLPNGMLVFAPYPPEAHYLYSDIYEYKTYDQYGIRYSANASIVDVGANIGLFSLYALEHAPGSRVIAIEPVPQLWTQLRRNVAAYGERVVSVNLALGERDYTGELTYYPATPGMSSLHPDMTEERALLGTILRNLAENGRPEIQPLFAQEHQYLQERLASESFPCRVRRLSRVCAELGVEVIDLLKIDVQKAELEVLHGIDDTDWPRIRQLVIEVHDIDGQLQKITDLLRARDYVVRVGEQAPIHRGSVVRFVYAIQGGAGASTAA
ncbi:non-ribosomal peptide synthetase [Dyella tabacisoli]|uniref:Amino acid adenylation domain-containing protein n=1 Tax=Dyella tabacisoli TaxID=2282381 RepID=A0A369UIQ3_9GAMM|nr:amino acid adenylation domain-containing protein [Dyella tabacisoli]RDD80426.1 amino acid adenylation domain-containing protein [Dyella tabacisoli]